MNQEPITWSLHLPYILESTFGRIFLFLEQFSPQASLNSQESILYSALYCVVVLYFTLLYGFVSQGLGTTKLTNWIGLNGY